MKAGAFEGLHPVIPAVYFAFVLVFCMAAFNPCLIVLSLAAGLVANIRLRGWPAVARTLRWQIPLFALVALLNPLVSASGSTLLVVLGPFPIYAESLLYGVCMGAMMVAAMLWFSNAAQMMGSDRVSSLLGARLPQVGLMISMVMRLVPQFVRRGAVIGGCAQAATASASANQGVGVFGEAPTARFTSEAPAPSDHKFAARVRQLSVLMGWSMEDALETANAMRARAWGATVARTTYERLSFGIVDAAVLIVVVALAACAMFFAVLTCAQSAFYPLFVMSPWWPAAVLSYVLVLALPAIGEVRTWLAWR